MNLSALLDSASRTSASPLLSSTPTLNDPDRTMNLSALLDAASPTSDSQPLDFPIALNNPDASTLPMQLELRRLPGEETYTSFGDSPLTGTMDMTDLFRVLSFADSQTIPDFQRSYSSTAIPLLSVTERVPGPDTAPLPAFETEAVIIRPPPQNTASAEAAITALHEWTKEHGFNMTKRRAFYIDSTSREVRKRGFDCDRAGKPKCTQHLTDDERQRPCEG